MNKNTAGINEPIWDSRNSDEPIYVMNGLKDDAAIAWIDFQNSDAMKNWRKYQRDRRRKFWLNILGSMVGAIFAIWMFGCTIAPHVTDPKKPSSWAKENIVGYYSNGNIRVKADWVRVYHARLKVYGDKLPITEQVSADDSTGITADGSYFRISRQTNSRFAHLERIEKESGP